MIATLGTILKWAIALPILVLILLLALANVQSVPVHLNPFNPEDPVLRVELALYQIVFIVFIAGALVGAAIVWAGKHRYRRRLRRQREELSLWQGRALQRDQPRPEPAETAGYLPRPERS